MMERRLSRQSSRESLGSVTLQKKIVESWRPNKTEHVPDLTDFMNDMFFGTMNAEKNAYNLTGSRLDDDEESFDCSTRSNSSRLTQEWLEEARRMVASSPSRCDSPSRLVGSPRFATARGRHSSASILDRRDPLSRSARRNRSIEGFGGEILTKSANHTHNKSDSLETTPNSPSEPSPASQVHNWFSNILKPSNPSPPSDPTSPHQSNRPSYTSCDQTAQILPLRQSTFHKSRFQNESPALNPQGIPIPTSQRTFKPAPSPDTPLLSPPKNLIESAHRRSIAKSTCSIEKVAPRPNANGRQNEQKGERDVSLTGFLNEQKTKILKIMNGKIDSKAKIIVSGASNSTSSMVAAICYAWLLENRLTKDKGESDGEDYVVAPVMNVKRARMWKQRQAAWLFHHVGLDANSLLFTDEVDLESLIVTGHLSILVVGQDILRTNSEVGSRCTILTDNYCEDAYDLLQTPLLKKLLLAGILLDTQNLNASDKLSTTRDAEAVQLLLVGSAPNYQNALFNQLMQDQRDNSFFEALRKNYGRPPSENGHDNGTQMEHNGTERKSTSTSHHEAIKQNSDEKPNDLRNEKTSRNTPKSTKPTAAPAQAAREACKGKNKFFLAKWFGFGSK